MNDFKSIFVPEEKINLPNCITEILIKNWLSYYNKPVPTCPFWRKEYASQSKDLEFLSHKYSLEIAAVHDYLKVFHAEVLITVLKKRKLGTLKYLKLDMKKDLINELFNAQVKANLPLVKCIETGSDQPVQEPTLFKGTTSKTVNKGSMSLL